MDFQLEKLSADLIDEDFAKVFEGLHLQQIIMARLTVQIKYGFVTAPSKVYFFYSVAIWTASILSLIGGMLTCEMADNSIIIDLYFKLGHILNVILVIKTIVKDIHENSSGEFYVKLHKIDRELDVKNAKENNRNLAKIVRALTVCLTCCAFLFVAILNIFCFKDYCPSGVFILWPELSNMCDMVMAAFIIYFVSIRVDYINRTLKAIRGKINGIKSCERVALVAQSCYLDEILWNRLLCGMQIISTVMTDFIDLFQYQIFSYTCQLMIWIMITIQCSILTIKNQLPLHNVMPSVFASVGMVMFMVHFFSVCIAADLFSNKLEETRKICVDIRHTSDDSISRHNAKRMLLLLEAMSDLSIYDIYTLSVRVPVKLTAIIATYTIVLLQFALE